MIEQSSKSIDKFNSAIGSQERSGTAWDEGKLVMVKRGVKHVTVEWRMEIS